jgi:hypothetical protein
MRNLNTEFLQAVGNAEPEPKESYDYFQVGVEYGVLRCVARLEHKGVMLTLAPGETRQERVVRFAKAMALDILDEFGICPECRGFSDYCADVALCGTCGGKGRNR